MVDVSKQFSTIEDNNKKLNNKLNIFNDSRNNADAGRKAIYEAKQLLSYNSKLVSKFFPLTL